MEAPALIALGIGILGFGLVSKRLQSGFVTPPMAFVVFGFAVGPSALDLLGLDWGNEAIHVLAELTLVVVLFTDAARIDLSALRRDYPLPLRLLGLGLPLCIAAGALAALALFPSLSVIEALLLSAVLAPTDAALGQAVVSNRAIPARVRQALNVESGLNDGLALPIVMILAASAELAGGERGLVEWLPFVAAQLGLGPLAGIAVGLGGGRLVEIARRSGWMGRSFQQLSGLALALLAYAGAEQIGGNGFVAAFIAGLTLGNTAREACGPLADFTETEGQLLVLATFLCVGAFLIPAGTDYDASMLLYAALSLTAVRMLPVALALVGLRLRAATVALIGWFGPRGLASILFGLLVVSRAEIANAELIFGVAIVTVLMSVFAHGLTAHPAATAYGRYVLRLEQDPPCPEHQPVTEMPSRMAGQPAA